MLVVSARVELASKEDADKFCQLAKDLVGPTREERGCTLYAMARDIVDECVVWISEEWESEEDLTNHLKADHIVKFLGDLAEQVNLISMDDKLYDVASVGKVVMPEH